VKKLLLVIFLFSIGWTVFSTPAHAITSCGNAFTEGQCDVLGGCGIGQKCTFGISGDNSCEAKSSCPTTGVVCGIGDTIGGCGPSNGCEDGKKCQADLGTGISFCSSVNANCSTEPTPTPISLSPASIPSPSPTVEPLPTNDIVCPLDSTVYPPNSVCHANEKQIESVGINLADSNSSLLSYPLTCVSAPTVSYSQTVTTYSAPTSVDVNVTSDVSNAQLGFLGPDSTTLATSNPDSLAKTYLFNALFDRPAGNSTASRESFRTMWRMLDSVSQGQLKAYYISSANPLDTYYYVGKDNKQHSMTLATLQISLPSCLKNFDIITKTNCSKNDGYNTEYLNLEKTSPALAEAYDALLPFDFSDSRAYLSNGTSISNENIPYLRAILTGLKGYQDVVPTLYTIPLLGQVSIHLPIVPGLFDYYTPSWADVPLAQYPTLPLGQVSETLSLPQYTSIRVVSSILGNNACISPTNTSSVVSPKTYPTTFGLLGNVESGLAQTVTVPVSSQLVSQGSTQCYCANDLFPCANINCSYYDNNQSSCERSGCTFYQSPDTYQITGSAVGKSITVFNNPYITSLTDLVLGGKPALSNNTDSRFLQALAAVANTLSNAFVNPVQPSFYKMLLPDFASESAKSYVSAPEVDTTTDNPNATAYGSDTIYRENNQAQDNMFLLQNCWLVPGDQQSSSKCGKAETNTCTDQSVPDLPISDASCTTSSNSFKLGSSVYTLPDSLMKAISSAASTYKVPASLIVGVIYGEGAFNSGTQLLDENFVSEHLKSCVAMPNCDENSSTINGIFQFYTSNWSDVKDAIKKIAPDREAHYCNLLDEIFAIAENLSKNRSGSPAFSGQTCFGIPLNPGIGASTSCSWSDSDIETAIRIWEFGTAYNSTYGCATKRDSCATGGGQAANCETGGDTCETINNRQYYAGQPSHNACLWDAYTNNK